MEEMSRQVRRQSDRRAMKQDRVAQRASAAKSAKRALLDRQTSREKSGFYGRPVAEDISPSRSRITKRKVNKGHLNARIILEKIKDGRELRFHATKGWRSYRLED